MEIASKYEKYFKKISKKSFLNKIFSLFMLNLPHILTVLILSWIFPQYTIPIILLGWIIPDFALFEHYLNLSKLNLDKNLIRKRIAEQITLITSIFLLLLGFWEISLAGFIHLILDYIGF